MYKGYKIIALCISKLKEEIHIELIKALNEEIAKYGYKLIVYNTISDLYWKNRMENAEKAVFELIDYEKTDALVIYEDAFYDLQVLNQLVKVARQHNTPTISIGSQCKADVNIELSDANGFRNIIRHMVEVHQCERLHFIAGLRENDCSRQRISIFRECMKQYGLPCDDQDISYGDFWDGPTRQAVRELLQKEQLPQAIICVNDSTAFTVCEELQKNGIRVPEDVAVTGFDGISEALFCTPQITSCRFDYTAIAHRLVSVVEQINRGEQVKDRYVIDFCLDIHVSCGCQRQLKIMDAGKKIRESSDRMNRYLEAERALNEITEATITTEKVEKISQNLQRFPFKNISILLNQSCMDNTVNPIMEEREHSFDEQLYILLQAGEDNGVFPRLLQKDNYLIPNIDQVIAQPDPLVITALGFMGVPLGYIAVYEPVSLENYSNIQQYTMTLNNLIGCNRNVRYIKYVAKRREEDSYRDYMTGLYNRTGFYSVIAQFAAAAVPGRVMVVSVDMDGLKYINDNFGHVEGDFAIRKVAEAIRSISAPQKICARFGGDEFAVCVCLDEGQRQQDIINELRENIRQANRGTGNTFCISASIGACVCDAADFAFETALQTADKIMYEEKKTKPHHRK